MARGRGRGRGGGSGAAPATYATFEGNFSPPNHYKAAELPFTGHAGIKVPTEGFKLADYYKLFLTQNLLRTFVGQTNLYAQQTIETAKSKPGSLKKHRLGQWSEEGRTWSEEGMNMEELQRFLGLTLLMGLVCKPTLEMYCQAIFVTPMFNSIMTSK